MIPGGSLLAYLNADHWALAIPIARNDRMLATLFVYQNAYPAEALAEAMLRMIEEDLTGQ